ncbi:MAG: GNAT family N-acetyltransferase [Dysosmobacter sp.]
MITLKTWRLLLAPGGSEDAEALYALASDPEIGPIVAGNPTEAWRKAGRSSGMCSARRRSARFSAERRRTAGSGGPSAVIGDFPELSATEQREMGYWLGRPAYWGHGVMTEAATELLRFGFETLGLEAVWCSHYDWNSRSRRVIEKCGFRYQFTKETTNVIGMTNKAVFTP